MPITFVPSSSLLNMLSGPLAAPDFTNAWGKGFVQGVNLAGRTTAPSTSGLGDIWGFPSVTAAQEVRANPTSPFTIAVVSDSASDTSAGTGCQLLYVYYLDSLYNPYVAVYAMNGQTAVTSAVAVNAIQPNGGTTVYAGSGAVTNAIRINGLEVYTAGSGYANAGNIYCTASTGQSYTGGVPQVPGLVYDFMYSGDSVDATSAFTVPNGYAMIVVQFIYGAAATAGTPAYGRFRLASTSGNNLIYRGFDTSLSSNEINIVPEVKPVFAAMTDLRAQCQVSAALEVTCNNLGLMWSISA